MNELQNRFCELVRRFLHDETLSNNEILSSDDMFELGFDSITYVEFLSEIEETYGMIFDEAILIGSRPSQLINIIDALLTRRDKMR